MVDFAFAMVDFAFAMVDFVFARADFSQMCVVSDNLQNFSY